MENWLHSYVEWKGNVVKRGFLLKFFLNEGLLPFMDSMGYIIGTSPKILFSCIVCGLYRNQNKSTLESVWDMKYYTPFWTDEDRMHYYHVVDPTTWDEFWMAWNDIDDFSQDSYRGQDRRTDIEEFIWRQIDLDSSYQTEVLYELMNDYYEPEPDEASKKIDVYLLETTGWGGLRS